LADLPGSTDGVHEMAFDHFQSFSGTIRLPAGTEPRQVVVDIQPTNDNLLSSSEAFVWHVAQQGDGALEPVVKIDVAD
jgi:hypothetical protein